MVGGRRPSVEDTLQWEDDLWRKTTIGGRQPSVEDDLEWKTPFSGSMHAAYSALRHILQMNGVSLSLPTYESHIFV